MFGSWLKAPSKPGKYAFQWQVARTKGGALFGEPTEQKIIAIEARPEEPEPEPRKQNPTGRHVLVFEDFEYAGSFRGADYSAGRRVRRWTSVSDRPKKRRRFSLKINSRVSADTPTSS